MIGRWLCRIGLHRWEPVQHHYTTKYGTAVSRCRRCGKRRVTV